MSNMSNQDVIRKLEEQKAFLRLEYESKLEGIDYALSILKGHADDGQLSHTYIGRKTISSKPSVHSDPDFKRNKIKGRIVDFITKSRRFVHNREITEAIYDERYGFHNKKQFSRYLSTSLWTLKKNGKLVKFKHDASPKNMFWGLPEWIENGKIKPEYEYNRQLLT